MFLCACGHGTSRLLTNNRLRCYCPGVGLQGRWHRVQTICRYSARRVSSYSRCPQVAVIPANPPVLPGGQHCPKACELESHPSYAIALFLTNDPGMSMKTKARPKEPTSTDASLSKQGDFGLPSSDEEGLGVVQVCQAEPVSPWNLCLPTIGFRRLKGDKESRVSQEAGMTTFSREADRTPLYFGALQKKPPYIVFSLLTRPYPLCYVWRVALASGAQPVKPNDPDVLRDYDSPFGNLLLFLTRGGLRWRREMP